MEDEPQRPSGSVAAQLYYPEQDVYFISATVYSPVKCR